MLATLHTLKIISQSSLKFASHAAPITCLSIAIIITCLSIAIIITCLSIAIIVMPLAPQPLVPRNALASRLMGNLCFVRVRPLSLRCNRAMVEDVYRYSVQVFGFDSFCVSSQPSSFSLTCDTFQKQQAQSMEVKTRARECIHAAADEKNIAECVERVQSGLNQQAQQLSQTCQRQRSSLL
jgi:hypothetical protein